MVSLSQLYCLSKGVRLLFFFFKLSDMLEVRCYICVEKVHIIRSVRVSRTAVCHRSDLKRLQGQDACRPLTVTNQHSTSQDNWNDFFSAAIFINRKIQQSDVFNLPLVFFFFRTKTQRKSDCALRTFQRNPGGGNTSEV